MMIILFHCNRAVSGRMLCAVAFALALLAGGCSDGQLSASENINRAQAAREKGDLSSAAIYLKNAIQAERDNAQARLMLGKVYIGLGDGASATKELQRAVQLGVNEDTVTLDVMRAALLQRHFEDILAEKAPPDDASAVVEAEYWTLRGYAYLGKGDADKASGAYARALEYSPGFAEALTGQAQLAWYADEPEKARQLVDQALSNDKGLAAAWSFLGEIELKQKDPAAAEKAFTNAIKLRYYVSSDMAKRALARANMGKFDEAHADLEFLKKHKMGSHPYVKYVEGVTYFKQEQYKEAAQEFESAVTVAPRFLEATTYLSITNFVLGNMEQALKFGQSAMAQAPYSVFLKRLVASIYIRRSEYDHAESVLREALKEKADDEETLAMLSGVAMLRGDAKKGADYAQQVASLKPDDRRAQDMVLLTKLLAGQRIDQAVMNDAQGTSNEEDDYSRQLMFALGLIRQGDPQMALERGRALHEQFPDRVDPMNVIAASYLAMAQWDNARAQLEMVLKVEPNNPSAARNLAKLETQQGHLGRADTLLTDLLQAHPQDEEAALMLGEVTAKLHGRAATLAVLKQALDRNPGATKVRFNLASNYLRDGEFAAVLELTRDVDDRQFRREPRLLALRGTAELRTGDVASAERSFARWTELSPDSAEAQFMYGESLARGGNVEDARKALKRTLELDPNYLPARVGEVKMLVQKGDLKAAKSKLDKLHKDFKDRPEVLGIEGWYALGTRDYATAESRLRAALQKNPDTDLVLYLATALRAQGKQDEAEKVMQDWLATRPRDLAVLTELAGAYIAAGKEAQAREVYAKVVNYYPNYVPALNNLAWFTQDKDLAQALKYAQRAQGLAPTDPYVLDTLGMLLLKDGKIAEGVRKLRAAAESAPNDAEVSLHLGEALLKQGTDPEAREILNKVIAQSTDAELTRRARRALDSTKAP